MPSISFSHHPIWQKVWTPSLDQAVLVCWHGEGNLARWDICHPAEWWLHLFVCLKQHTVLETDCTTKLQWSCWQRNKSFNRKFGRWGGSLIWWLVCDRMVLHTQDGLTQVTGIPGLSRVHFLTFPQKISYNTQEITKFSPNIALMRFHEIHNMWSRKRWGNSHCS